MKCLEKDQLISYAYGLTDESAAREVRAHLGECSHCRATVEQYGRLDSLLDEWKAAEPTPEFDVRVRQAVDVRNTGRAAWAFWNWGWARGLALAGLAVMVASGAVWFSRGHRRISTLARIAARPFHSASAAPRPARAAILHAAAPAASTGVRLAPHTSGPSAATASRSDDNDVQALEDYDMAANFDVLSEIPKGDSRIVY